MPLNPNLVWKTKKRQICLIFLHSFAFTSDGDGSINRDTLGVVTVKTASPITSFLVLSLVLVGNVNRQEEVNRARNCLSCKTKRLNARKRVFSLHPLLITAACRSSSFPWLTPQPWSELSPLPANISVCVCVRQPTVCITTQNAPITAWHTGEDDSPSGPVLARGDAAGFSALSSRERAVSALRHWGAMKSSADSKPTGPQQQVKMGQRCDDGRLCRGGGMKRGSALVLN